MYFDYSKLYGKIREIFQTQHNLANAIGMGRTSLNMKLNGHSEFTSNEIFAISSVLGIPSKSIPMYFFCRKGSEKRT